MDRPVKEYSSGMYVRLAFSTAIHVDPEILIVDEALAVGDAVFANRCVRKFQEFREHKITVLFVSHDLGLVKQLSDRAILLLNGRIEAEGARKRCHQPLHRPGARKTGDLKQKRRSASRSSFRHGDGASEILDVEIPQRPRRANRKPSPAANQSPSASAAAFTARKVDPMVGILIRTRIGMEVYGTNTRIEQVELGSLQSGDELEVDFHIACWLTAQQYTLTVATQKSRRLQPRLAGRRHRLRSSGYPPGGWRRRPAGGGEWRVSR